MDVFDEENSGRAEIPGLPDSERGNKKGKKKGGGGAKKTLSLQNFLQDENQEPPHMPCSPSEQLEAHMVKLNLDEEELIVMESCHSFIHDMLRQLGPIHAMDPILTQEINKFPDEAKKIIQKCGGYRNFILRSKDLAVVDKIVAAKSDLKNAQEMAFKEIYNSLPPTPRNDNIPGDSQKEIWSSNNSNLNKQSGTLWSNYTGDQGGQEALHSAVHTGGKTDEFYPRPPGPPDPHYSAQQNLLKGLGQSMGHQAQYSSDTTNSFQGGLEERVWKLQEENQQLLQRVSDRDQEVSNLRSSLSSLESLQHNTKNDLMVAQAEVEQVKGELARVSREVGGGQEVASLKASLEQAHLRNLALTQELEMKKHSPPGLFSSSSQSSIPRGPWQTADMPSVPLPGDSDLLGLRSMVPGPWSGDMLSAPPSSLLPPSSQGNSFLQGGHRGHDMFGGLGLGSGSRSGLGLGPGSSGMALGPGSGMGLGQGSGMVLGSGSGSGPGMGLGSGSGMGLGSASSSGMGLGAGMGLGPGSGMPPEFHSMLGLPRSSSPSMGLSLPSPPQLTSPPHSSPPTLPSLPPSSTPPSLPTSTTSLPPPQVPQGKTARQEMLVKKLVTMLPPGTSEETIKNSIQVLRAQHGKLSGWPTSRIAAAIKDLLHQGDV